MFVKSKAKSLVWLPFVLACSALPVSALIRSPVDSKCQSYGLKGCPELVDGAIAYADGNKAVGIQKLEAARALNTPEKLKPFADALRTIGKTGPEAAAPLVTVADILAPVTTTEIAAPALSTPPRSTDSSVAMAPAHSPQAADAFAVPRLGGSDANVQPILLALTASTDPVRMFTRTINVRVGELNCDVAGDRATCDQLQEGPVIVTDVVASPACADRAFLIAALSDTMAFGEAWAVPAGTPGIHGARLVVKPNEWLHVGARPLEKASVTKGACFVTWSGFRPRLLPNKLWG